MPRPTRNGDRLLAAARWTMIADTPLQSLKTLLPAQELALLATAMGQMESDRIALDARNARRLKAASRILRPGALQ